VGGTDEVRVVGVNALKEDVKDCPEAVTAVDNEFKNSKWSKNPDLIIDDYRALIRILNIYNTCK
jgi:hypothetical protein